MSSSRHAELLRLIRLLPSAAILLQNQTLSVLDCNHKAVEDLGRDPLGEQWPEIKDLVDRASSLGSVCREPAVCMGVACLVDVAAHGDWSLIIFSPAPGAPATSQVEKMALLGRFATDMAHEIRNPLSAVQLNLQLLRRSAAAQKKESAMIDIALEGVQRVVRLLDTTLDFSKPASVKPSYQRPGWLAAKAVEQVKQRFAQQATALKLDVQPDLPAINADADLFIQALEDILINAADAVRRGGTVQLRVTASANDRGQEFLQYEIEDNGHGIAESDIAQVFDPFFTKKAQGTGLGLAIVKRTIEQHNGTVWVKSTVGVGTIFYISLPVPS